MLHEILAQTFFRTDDTVLGGLLDVRCESLEKLWDACERLKTLELGNDKKASTKALLDKAASKPNLRVRLEQEAVQLRSATSL